MKIESFFFSDKDKTVGKKKARSASGKSFLSVLSEYDPDVEEIELDYEDIEKEDLEDLAGMIDDMGRSLSQNPTAENFVKYKKYIQVFIKAFQKNMEIHDTLSRVSFTKQKLYKTIEMVDENLAGLAGMIMKQEQNRLQFLKLVDNIKGLIVDLLL